jgi:DNA repair exonuclease SbcCD nuclease subunit
MAKWLLVGDPHAVADELEDCRRLVKGVLETIASEKPDYVLFMGDQHHNHALMHVEVMAFWREAFTRLGQTGAHILALVGNHDMPGDGTSKNHAMMAYEGIEGVHVVDTAGRYGGCLLIPYRHHNEDFVNDVLMCKTKIVLCHQTFDGGKYENGFYAQNGVELKGLEDRWFISGHIHTPQAFANVTYIGAPRWRSLSDVGIERALVLVDLVEDQPPKFLKLIDTGAYCEKIVHLIDRQEEPLEPSLKPGWKYIVDIHGDEVFIKARRPLWAGARVRTFKTRQATKPVSESMGIGKAIQAFMEGYRPKYGTDVVILRGMVAQRLGIS